MNRIQFELNRIRKRWDTFKENLKKTSDRKIKVYSFIGVYIFAHVILCAVLSFVLVKLSGFTNPENQIHFSLWNVLIPPNLSLLPVPILFGAVIAVFSFLNVFHFVKRKFFPPPNIEGSSRWMNPAEISDKLTAINKSDLRESTTAGIILASDITQIYVDPETVNTTIIGATRSGKTQLIVLPLIRLLASVKQKQSFVVNDTKGEIAENTYKILKESGYKVVILNFRDPKSSSQWNPLSIIIDEYVKAQTTPDKDISKVVELSGELANIITFNDKSDPIWPESAKSLLNAMILFLLERSYIHDCLDKLNMYSVYNFFLEYGTIDRTEGNRQFNALDELFQGLPVGNPAKAAYAPSNFARGEMRASIFSTLASNMQIFADTGIARLTSGNEIKFSDLADPEQPCAIFMVVPDEKVNRHGLASLFVNQCYSQLVDIANESPGRTLEQRVHFILDEFGNMPKIPQMDTKLTVSLGRNILWNLVIQSFSQIESKYGKDIAATMRGGGCGNLIYIYTKDHDTNEYVSKMLGKETLEHTTYSGRFGGIIESNQTSHLKGKPLLDANELALLPFGEAVTICQRKYPIKTTLDPFFRLGLPKTLLADIPTTMSVINVNDTLLPYKLICGGEMEFGEILTPTAPAAGVYQCKDIPAPPEKRPMSEAEKIQPVVDKINLLSQGKFGEHLDANRVSNAKALVGQVRMNSNKLSEGEATTLLAFLDKLKPNKKFKE